MHFKLKVQKLGTFDLGFFYFEIKPVKAKLKCFSLLYLRKKQREKYTKAFNKTEYEPLPLFHWYKNLNLKSTENQFAEDVHKDQ